MTIQLRTTILLILFGFYMPNNIIVPVHLLSHIKANHEERHIHDVRFVGEVRDDHESELIDCDTLHVTAKMALYQYQNSLSLTPLEYSAPSTPAVTFAPFITATAIYIRAPPYSTVS
jgi:hypothetical protein